MPEQITKKLLSWASILEDNTRQQAIRTASMPFIHPYLALMPDAHLGKGATVGSVIPTRGAIIPAAVGVDIGCGMIAVRTQWNQADFRDLVDLRALRQLIEDAVPLSAGKYNTQVSRQSAVRRIAELSVAAERAGFDPNRYAANWALQLGTLGSGNHFIEVSVDEDDQVWLFLHSGSRGIGNKIAQHHIKVAAELNARYFIDLADPDLAYLVDGTKEFERYIKELHWAQKFAYENRAEMMDRVVDVVSNLMAEPVTRTEEVNCHHNYSERVRIYGHDVWLSRKGAIDASKGTLGLIPGSMGTRSYVVEGKGNHVGLNSAPHGAGREYSRSAARKTFTHDQLREAMVDIEYRDTDAFIDEIPQAYKDIDVVMADAADLVEIRHTLRQIVNVKGD